MACSFLVSSVGMSSSDLLKLLWLCRVQFPWSVSITRVLVLRDAGKSGIALNPLLMNYYSNIQ